ncbi:HyaD/HybD family hydrogenase maturation endopeptidase [Geoalkalibacter halelectricus]|uniref:HyaD/HybD family hydrogenase maturation endopeptidase n=1 Tax=Geoalkalibacter halelectricus TaxID=2847045 RepID=A0ABY5ZNJ8_9BACT|nr:HyaD/HybD family hydrogenase maturation endopeptidase [Geoalkalibacter halelectricus]MDO3378374.1 HyaD/HybD family hydrogenase maturation endopeptidase [Geoalkalibacter halelectricus]UWZ80306.1 HyaD/HybD family hydrogenase maturation endopeptidase [Geoalkalibacter halelectricus]
MAILVLGLGNLLMSDDAFGGRVVEHLQEHYVFPQGVSVLDGGTLGLDLLPRLEGVARLLLVDAVDMQARPGSVFRLEGEEVPRAFAEKLSVHQMGLKDLLAVAELQGCLPGEIVFWGVQPGCIEMCLEMTEPVAEVLPRVVEAVLEELRRWGVAWRKAA